VLTEFGSRRRVCSKWTGCKLHRSEPGDKDGLEQHEAGQMKGHCGQAALKHKQAAQVEAGCMERAALYEEVRDIIEAV